MKSRIYRLIVIFVILPLLNSCNEQHREILIGLSQCSGDAWHTLMNQDILNEASLYPNVNVEILNANYDNSKQIADIQSLLNKKIDLLIVSPNEAEALTPIIESVYFRGIPVVLVDSKINSDKYTTFIGSDNEQIGRLAGQWISWRLREGGEIVVIEGLEGSTSTIDRSRGLEEELKNYPQIKTVAKMNGNWRGDETKESFGKILTEYPDVDVVFAQNDYMAIAASEVADSLLPDNKILFLGVDALCGEGLGIEAIMKGKINASIIYEPGGITTLQTALAILRNDTTVQKEILMPINMVGGYNNARIMQIQREHIDNMHSQIQRLNDILSFSSQQVRLQQNMLVSLAVIISLILIVLALLAKFFYDRVKANQLLKKQKEQVEKLSKQLEQATSAKISFFTNVSHDFRTPLTLITDPILQLEKSANLDAREKSMLQIAHKNVLVLLRLINQILDFRKYEDGKLALNATAFDLKKELMSWLESFRAAAILKNVRYEINVKDGNYYMVADQEKIERIVYNLLSNAFKFTKPEGLVSVSTHIIESELRMLHLEIADTGIGISKNDIEHIFDNFYQSEVVMGGSGIGLAVVNSFVKLHNGTVNVQSTPGEGTTFIVEIPMETAMLEGQVLNSNDTYNDLMQMASEEGALIDATQITINLAGEPLEETSKPVVLVVEDNKDVRDYIRLQLSDKYSILETANGKDGVALAAKYVPDVVVSDIMMPVMNGTECCRKLKSELQTSHIPVLMLTAYGMDEQKIEAFSCGADGYLTKPFSTDVLIARIDNLIENRKNLQDLFKSTDVRGLVDESTLNNNINNVDRSFLKKLNDIIEQRMADANLSVEDIGQEIGLSRVQLYRKSKSITGQAPNELLRMARLKKAELLLENSNMNVSEVAFAVGFNSSSYFTKCYKDYFGVAPKEFLKRNSNAGE